MMRITLRMTDTLSEEVAKMARTEQKSKNGVIVEACENLINRFKERASNGMAQEVKNG